MHLVCPSAVGKLYFTTLFPMALVVLLKLLSKSGTISYAEQWRATIWMLFSLYPKVCEQIMSAFRCHELANGNAYLISDLAVACDETYELTVRPFAMAMFVIYALGTPFLFWLRLYAYRDVLDLPGPEKQLGFLYRDCTCSLRRRECPRSASLANSAPPCHACGVTRRANTHTHNHQPP